MVVLGVLVLTLGVLLLERSPVLKATSCTDAHIDFGSCYFPCTVQNITCHIENPNTPQQCENAMNNCLRGCDTYHSQYGLACELANYSAPYDPNSTCEENADRLYANCLSGPVPFAFRETYFACMTAANGDLDQLSTCCDEAKEHYLYVGCY